jgi:hypothetical protein
MCPLHIANNGLRVPCRSFFWMTKGMIVISFPFLIPGKNWAKSLIFNGLGNLLPPQILDENADGTPTQKWEPAFQFLDAGGGRMGPITPDDKASG